VSTDERDGLALVAEAQAHVRPLKLSARTIDAGLRV
jgi:hypothetical protein